MGKAKVGRASVATADASDDTGELKTRRRGGSAVLFRVADDAESEGALAMPIGMALFAAVLAIYVQVTQCK